VDTRVPTILTTSQLLTTGVDAPTCKNVVLARVVGSMIEFKQMIGRGTRVRDDYGKLWFNIIDYTGSATRLFADPDFDGDPTRITEEEITAAGEVKVVTDIAPGGEREPESEVAPEINEPSVEEHRKFYFDGGRVEIIGHTVHELDPNGKQLRVVKYTDYAAESVRILFPGTPNLREEWADPTRRSEIIEKLAERGISFDELAETAGQPDADPFDLLCHLAFNAPLRTRRERAQHLRETRKDFFDRYGEEARRILEELLEKYAVYGDAQFLLPDVLHVPPISNHGTVADIVNIFGGADKLRQAVTELQKHLYAA
jgi:type I restriction enzyme R subunit